MKETKDFKKLQVAGVAICMLACINFTAFSQKSTHNNYLGNWSDDNSWTDGAAIGTTDLPTSGAGGFDIIINGYISVGSYSANQDLTFAANKDNYDFIVNDTLVVYGDVMFANKAMNLVVNSGGLLIILGNLDMNNKMDIASDGNLVVQGTFNKIGVQGTYSGWGNVYAGAYTGSASALVPYDQEKNTSSDLQADLPLIWEFLNIGGQTTLPVALAYFNARQIGNAVKLSWKTATELDNDFFTIERSQNGTGFEALGSITGAGSTNELQYYEYIDENPYWGLSYYRLKQTDFDGTTEIFRPVSFSFEGGEQSVAAYPNPLFSNELTLSIAGLNNNNSEIKMRILDAKGYAVFEKRLHSGSTANYFEKFDLDFLPEGCYIISLANDMISSSIKLVRK